MCIHYFTARVETSPFKFEVWPSMKWSEVFPMSDSIFPLWNWSATKQTQTFSQWAQYAANAWMLLSPSFKRGLAHPTWSCFLCYRHVCRRGQKLTNVWRHRGCRILVRGPRPKDQQLNSGGAGRGTEPPPPPNTNCSSHKFFRQMCLTSKNNSGQDFDWWLFLLPKHPSMQSSFPHKNPRTRRGVN